MPASKKRDHFSRTTALPSTTGSISHQAGTGRKKIPDHLIHTPENELPQKYKNTWFIKKYDTKDKPSAVLEVTAQEFFRLFDASHPKTRLLIDEKNNYYTASKSIPGAQKLPRDGGEPDSIKKDFNENIKNGVYKGLGTITLLSLFFYEVDLKNGNIVLNHQNQFIKFDGDWCLAPLSRWTCRPIAETQIASLPAPINYNPHNWLGYTIEGTHKPYPLLETDISNNAYFRHEVNSTMLKIILMPQSIFEKFIDVYAADHLMTSAIKNFIIERHIQLKQAAMQNQSFQDYLSSPEAELEVEEYLKYARSFNTTKKNRLFEEQHAEEFRKNLADLRFKLFNHASAEAKVSNKENEQAAHKIDIKLSSAKQALFNNPHTDSATQLKSVIETGPIVTDTLPSSRLAAYKYTLRGLGLALLAAAAFIALRAIEVLTFGLSLPITI
ncbi:MAG TPA: hypothetical protein VHA13_01715, partial [Gammaproteobacteria bacterium]|nr:hypothetical protein [Gammaproteobacteria bacterium]